MTHLLVHYSEIGLKGKNRAFFENKLVSNIRSALEGFEPSARRLYGKIVADVPEKHAKRATERLKQVPGIAYFSIAMRSGLDKEEIAKCALKLCAHSRAKSFAVSSRRSSKGFKLTSLQLNEFLGDRIKRKTKWAVDLGNPELTVFVEIGDKDAFLYTEKIRGIGGLPVSCSGKLLCLISGGIDSPVAAYRMMKRGCEIIFLHFHNHTSRKEVVKDKVERLVKLLSAYQPRTRLCMIPFADLQRQIIASIPARYRMIVYRRVMFRIANEIAIAEKAKGFVTGDSVGQVASQTLENLNVIYAVADLPVFAPLIGESKEAIIAEAKQLGTYETSILPYSDCCSFLIAQHPETRADQAEIDRLEKSLEIGKLVEEAVRKSKTTII